MRRFVKIAAVFVLAFALACGNPTGPEPDFEVVEGSEFARVVEEIPENSTVKGYAWGATIINRAGSEACVEVVAYFDPDPPGGNSRSLLELVRLSPGETAIQKESVLSAPHPKRVGRLEIEEVENLVGACPDPATINGD